MGKCREWQVQRDWALCRMEIHTAKKRFGAEEIRCLSKSEASPSTIRTLRKLTPDLHHVICGCFDHKKWHNHRSVSRSSKVSDLVAVLFLL